MDRMIGSGLRIEMSVCACWKEICMWKEIDSERKKHEHDTKGINKKNRLEGKKEKQV